MDGPTESSRAALFILRSSWNVSSCEFAIMVNAPGRSCPASKQSGPLVDAVWRVEGPGSLGQREDLSLRKTSSAWSLRLGITDGSVGPKEPRGSKSASSVTTTRRSLRPLLRISGSPPLAEKGARRREQGRIQGLSDQE